MAEKSITRAKAPGARITPTLRTERALLASGPQLVAGMDEVGRGALAGPVSVGVVVVDARTRTAPQGIADSKLLTPAAREGLAPKVRRWALAAAVGHASAAEIDAHGIIAALRLAGRRALTEVQSEVGAVDVVLLDGKHDWLSDPGPDLFASGGLDVVPEGLGADDGPGALGGMPDVVTMIKADMHCSSVAGASVLAKVERDGILTRLAGDHPHYGWENNKGYSAPAHLEALANHGPSVLHRRSWNLPGAMMAG
ncbi:ribonuclease HII [Myceligenerans xiligouense]|uniref:Ribonuclease n=1 Tax=Myceligenerans xiligouense TaxID=253184 RepID=A0A3N4YNE2_9MICO|nr:ribonuclease HII [Myceligenerans xiligouense]RPF22153.1 RNase HII [Myceligenerans xiligouense]